MFCSLFTDTVIDYFMNPRNVGKMRNADGEGSIKAFRP